MRKQIRMHGQLCLQLPEWLTGMRAVSACGRANDWGRDPGFFVTPGEKLFPKIIKSNFRRRKPLSGIRPSMFWNVAVELPLFFCSRSCGLPLRGRTLRGKIHLMLLGEFCDISFWNKLSSQGWANLTACRQTPKPRHRQIGNYI